MGKKWYERPSAGDARRSGAHPEAPRTPRPRGAASDDAWIGIGDAASHLAIPVRTLYRLAQRGQVPAAKVGRTWRFKRSVLDARFAGATASTSHDRFETPLGAPGDHRGPEIDADGHSLRIVTALADLSVELSALADTAEIARYLGARLRDIFGVDLAGLMRLEGAELVTVLDSNQLALPAGTRFRLADAPVLAEVIEGEAPLVIEDLAADARTRGDLVSRLNLRSAVFVPIRIANQTWGVLTLATRVPRRFSVLEIDRLISVAGQTALAVTNARLLTESRRWSEQLERIEALSRHLSRSRAVEAVADAVANGIESVIDWHGLRFYILASDGETLEAIKLRSKVPHYAEETPDRVRLRLGRGLGGHIAVSRVAEIVNDAARDPRMTRVPGTEDVDESMIVVPFVYEDTVLGVLELFRLGLDAFDATDLRLAQIVGAQAAVALSNARQIEELKRGSDALERRLASQRQLLAITERLLVHRERGAVFEAIADTLADVVPHDTLTIYLVDRTAGCLVPILARDEYAGQILATRPTVGSGITGDVIEKGEAEMINDAGHDPRVVHVPGTPTDEGESMIVAPIRNPDGVIGALNLYRTERHFDDEDLELVRLFTNHVAIALENATTHDLLVDAALTDPLTGLPNRRLFAERIDHALTRDGRAGGHVAVLFLDLDRFKLVNDGLGHAAGDAVLRAVAGRLRECTRAADTVARLGGDEFGVLLEDVDGEAEAVAASQRITAALSTAVAFEGRAVSVRASIGVALDRGADGFSSVDLLRDADTAMYQAKANGRGGFEVFETSMHAGQLARLELDSELREAIARKQFALAYQPIIDLATGRIVGAEALLRWHHPTRVISPLEFIKVAEESGEIVPIGAWVIREAAQQARRWQLAGGSTAELRISVNTSTRELVEPTFVATVEAALAASGLAPGDLTLEITESVMLADETHAIATLRALRDRGVHIVVDDFGTGYSSLSYVQRLPVDGLKIDRSFIEGLGAEPEKCPIVQAILDFARALGLTVTAEGIESEPQLRQLLALRCALGQGDLFARPLEPDAMFTLLQSRPAFLALAPKRVGVGGKRVA